MQSYSSHSSSGSHSSSYYSTTDSSRSRAHSSDDGHDGLASVSASSSSSYEEYPDNLPQPVNTSLATTGADGRRQLVFLKASPDASEDSSLDMELLQKGMNQQQKQYAKLLMEQSKYTEEGRNIPESVHIILFHPDAPKQHVHTIEIPKGSGNNLILAFEASDDCNMFAQMLKEMEFVEPSPQETMFQPFADFCQSMSIPILIVPAGFDLKPPQIYFC
ncbi:hypothetical protein ACHAWC_011254 [Mediolabrus comicus]